jgi:hypothetical protein
VGVRSHQHSRGLSGIALGIETFQRTTSVWNWKQCCATLWRVSFPTLYLRLRRLVLSPNAEPRENSYRLFGEIGYLQDGADGFKEGINPC